MADRFEPVGPDTEKEKRPASSKLFWFVALAVAGAIVVAGAAYVLRALLFIG
jgi:hypothetical protein